MRKHNEKAITLIALIITIIILLILAGITVSLVAGQDGILKHAGQAKIETEKSEIADMLALAVANIKVKSVAEKQPLLSYYETSEVFIQKGEFDVVQYPITGYELSEEQDKVTLSAKKQGGTGREYIYQIDIETGKVTNIGEGTAGEIPKVISRINYVLNGGSFEQESITQYTEGETVGLSVPKKTGAAFDGWYQNASFSGECIYRTTENMTGDITVYAKWIEETNADYFTYTTSDGKDTITGLSDAGKTAYANGEINNLIIPRKHGENDIVAIKSSAFSSRTTLTRIVIQDNIETVEGSAFSNCTGITELVVPISLSVGNAQFVGCTAIKTVKFTKGTGIGLDHTGGKYDVNYCLGTPWYYSRNSVTELVFEEGITSIGANTFNYCTVIQNISFPCTLEKIGEKAFYSCSGITKIQLPNVKEIGNYAFRGCSGVIEELILPEQLKIIGENAFEYCTIPGTLIIPDRIEQVGNNAFNNCTNIEKVIIPDNVETIGEKAFNTCTGIKEVIVPVSLSLENLQFIGCTGITKITFTKGTGIGADHSYVMYNSSYGMYTWEASKNSLKEVEFEEGITSIGAKSLYNSTALQKVTFPSTLEKIGENAFFGCSGLTKIQLPDGIKEIGNYAFRGCSGVVEELVLPKQLKKIGEYAFYNCKMKGEIVIPDRIEQVGNYAFCDCTNIEKVVIPDSVDTIGERTFSGCTGIKEVVVPISLTLENLQFIGCTGITKITFTKGTGIGSDHAYVMYNSNYGMCTWEASKSTLKEVEFEEGIISIGINTLYNSTALEQVSLPSTLKTIEEQAFWNCYNATFNYNGSQSGWNSNVTVESGNDKVTENLNCK
ncbi:MAG: leucine-rich repeat protein [Clostridia bacterium]|nr:leucine-rich repeat protein [Clostridia bacterium]